MYCIVYYYIGLREYCEDDLVDVGCNADLYVANQKSTDSSSEAQVGDALFAFNISSQDLFHFKSWLNSVHEVISWLISIRIKYLIVESTYFSTHILGSPIAALLLISQLVE